jgi:hypothetical protein
MAEPIVPKSPPKESNKTESKLDSEICLNESQRRSPEMVESIHIPTEIPRIIREAAVCYLPGPADHFVGILEETIANLTRLHGDLSEIQKMLVKGGVL